MLLHARRACPTQPADEAGCSRLLLRYIMIKMTLVGLSRSTADAIVPLSASARCTKRIALPVCCSRLPVCAAQTAADNVRMRPRPTPAPSRVSRTPTPRVLAFPCAHNSAE
ncbi:hypothetical protein BD413DRAFT_583104 [Trametes elegans]|nr:hypothetical protein BD413DRAFT_583104 [Trametes elegans]